MLFKISNLKSNFALTLGYLNPALNNSARDTKKYSEFYEKIPTYPSEVLLRKMLGRGEVALGLGAESCAAACIPADGGTLKIGTL